jgi:hypothetical protein
MPTTDLLAATLDAWHRVAGHVLAAAQHTETGEITLRPVAGGFQTTHVLPGNRRLAVVNTELVISDDSGTRAAPPRTLSGSRPVGRRTSIRPPHLCNRTHRCI